MANKIKCKCGAKLDDLAHFEAHRKKQRYSYDHYRVNSKGKEYKEMPTKAKPYIHQGNKTKIKGELAAQNKRVNEILNNAKMRLYLDIDEANDVNIYVESQDDLREFSGSYKTIDGAIQAAHSFLFGGPRQEPYMSKTEIQILYSNSKKAIHEPEPHEDQKSLKDSQVEANLLESKDE